MQKAWLEGVLPVVLDPESSVQDKALEALDEVLLSQVKPYSASHHMSSTQRLTWDLLGLLCNDCHHLRLDLLHLSHFVIHSVSLCMYLELRFCRMYLLMVFFFFPPQSIFQSSLHHLVQTEEVHPDVRH